MPPPKKRPRAEVDADMEDVEKASSQPQTKKQKMEDNDGVVGDYYVMPKDPARVSKSIVMNLTDTLDTLVNTTSDTTPKEDSQQQNQKQQILIEDASVHFLQLKHLQRQIWENTQQIQHTLETQTQTKNQQLLKLENLKYQQLINETSYEKSSNAIETITTRNTTATSETTSKVNSELVKLVTGRSDNKSDNNNAVDIKHIMDEEEQVDMETKLTEFLGIDYKNPSSRTTIISKLNQEIQDRQSLELELKQGTTHQKLKQDLLRGKQKLLADLPTKLNEIEKATFPLQKFIQQKVAGEDTIRIGTKRQQRFEMAYANLKTKPMYTLYYQIQSCLDIMRISSKKNKSTPTEEDTTTNNPLEGDDMPIVDVETTSPTTIAGVAAAAGDTTWTDPNVVLKIPIPTISSDGSLSYRPKKTATITFQYDTNKNLITAKCSTEYDMGNGSIIGELFPGDFGIWIPNNNDNNHDGSQNVEATAVQNYNGFKPYQWCNYLAGIHLLSEEGQLLSNTKQNMYCSASVIIKTLMRRVRATATLSWILHSLSRKPQSIPIHHAVKQKSEDEEDANDANPSIKLTHWGLVNTTTNDESSKPKHKHIRVYEATLKETSMSSVSSSKALQARVYIDIARYPSIPPKWKIIPDNDSVKQQSVETLHDDSNKQNTIPLYDEDIAQLQKHINRDIKDLVISSDQTTYDWIVAHQLDELIRSWNELLTNK